MRATFFISLLVAITLVLGACAQPTPQVVTQEVISTQLVTQQVVATKIVTQEVVVTQVVEKPRDIKVVKVAMGYIPNFQYAPFYVALEKGYFAQEGLQVIMDYGTEEDAVKKVASGSVDFGTSSGDSIILARSNGIPVKYVMRWYNGWPTAIFSLAEKNITKPQDLVGKTVGMPGPFGANWVAWQALLDSQGIDPNSITVQMIGFTQVSAVSSGQVDAAAGYSVNEPLQLEQQGVKVNVINTSDYVNLVPIGMFSSEDFIKNNPDTVRSFVRALMQGIQDTVKEPDFALEAVIRAVQYSGGENRAATKAGLDAAIKYWTDPGAYDDKTFDDTQNLMLKVGMITQATPVKDMYTNEFLP